MNKLIRSFLYIFTITAVLLTSALGTTIVYADGGTSDDPVVVEPPAETPEEPTAESSEVSPTEESIEAPAANETPQEEAVPVEEPVVVPEILEQVPEGTDLVVVNEEGDLEPLASEEAAEILVEGDPIWCPAGQVPTPGANGCTASHAGFDDLISDLTGGSYSGDGVIWVESSYDANEDSASIIFDGTSGNLASLSAISVLGGWNGVSGSTSTDTSNPSVLDDPMIFTNWIGAISISNLDFQGALGVTGSIDVETDGDITLTNVTESGNTSSSGVYLDNCLDGGSGCTTSGDVTVTDSTFAGNNGDGLNVESAGEVVIKDVDSNNNTNDGLNLTTEGNLKVKNTTLTDNGSEGVETQNVDGNVTLVNITSTGARDGVVINATYGDVYVSNTTASDNTFEGVEIHNTHGNVTLSSVTAENNSSNGIEIVNVDGGLTLYCVQTNYNSGDGIYVSVDHDFTIKCSQSTDNGGDGLQIDTIAPTAQLKSFTATGNTGLDINYDSNFTTVTEKQVDCNAKKKITSKGEKGPWTKLYCLPGEIKVALYDTYGDKIEFDNLCGYDAGVFDPNSWILPEEIPGGGDEYINSLFNRMQELLPNFEPNTEHGMPGIIAQVMDELPFIMPEGYSYASAFFTAVLDDGELLDPLPEESGLTVRFRVPEWLDADEELTILWWDGMDWVDLGGEYSEDGYYFEVTTEETGVFVLATFEIES